MLLTLLRFVFKILFIFSFFPIIYFHINDYTIHSISSITFNSDPFTFILSALIIFLIPIFSFFIPFLFIVEINFILFYKLDFTEGYKNTLFEKNIMYVFYIFFLFLSSFFLVFIYLSDIIGVDLESKNYTYYTLLLFSSFFISQFLIKFIVDNARNFFYILLFIRKENEDKVSLNYLDIKENKEFKILRLDLFKITVESLKEHNIILIDNKKFQEKEISFNFKNH